MAELETPSGAAKKQKRCHLIGAIYNYTLQGTIYLGGPLRSFATELNALRRQAAPLAPELSVIILGLLKFNRFFLAFLIFQNCAFFIAPKSKDRFSKRLR